MTWYVYIQPSVELKRLESITQATAEKGAQEWSQEFDFKKSSEFHEDFKQPPGTPYKPGAAHFGIWWEMGQPVCLFRFFLHNVMFNF